MGKIAQWYFGNPHFTKVRIHFMIEIIQKFRFGAHKTSLTPPLFIEVPVQCERSCICVLGVLEHELTSMEWGLLLEANDLNHSANPI